MAYCGKQLFFKECNTPEQGWPRRSAGAAPAVSGCWHELAKSTKGLGEELPPLFTDIVCPVILADEIVSVTRYKRCMITLASSSILN